MPSIRFEDLVRDVPDFPQPGILFKDITPLLADEEAFDAALDVMCQPFRDRHLDKIIGIESRGFIFGAAVADRLRTAFVPVRKPGKLPWKVVRKEYQLEYGTDALEVHEDAIAPGDQVLVVDDVLATGGTARAAVDLVTEMSAAVAGVSVFVELDFLNGRAKLADVPVHTVVHYGDD